MDDIHLRQDWEREYEKDQIYALERESILMQQLFEADQRLKVAKITYNHGHKTNSFSGIDEETDKPRHGVSITSSSKP